MAGRTSVPLGTRRILWIAAAAAAAVSAASLASGAHRAPIVRTQTGERAKQLAAGKILVARRGLLDPNFAKTVVLLVQHDGDGTMGVIINRPTKVTLSRFAEQFQGIKGRTDLVYLGGPVETTSVMALVRSKSKPDDSKRVLADVFMVSTKAALEKVMTETSPPDAFRLYVGYAGWDADQLEWELGLDAWDVVPADAAIIFDPHPETLWPRLAEQEGMQIARTGLGPGSADRECPARGVTSGADF